MFKWFIQRHKVNQLAFLRWLIKPLLNRGKNSVYIVNRGMVNKPRLLFLINPGKPSVCLVLGGLAKRPCSL